MKRFLLPFCIILAWQATCLSGLVDQLLLPQPLSVFKDLAHILGSAEGWIDISATIARTITGFALGLIAGTLLGFLVARSESIWTASEFSIDFLRSLPVTALIPLFFLFFGPGEIARISTVVYVDALIILLSVRNGIVSINPGKKEVISLYEFPKSRLLQVYLYESIPHLITASRLALSIALLVVIVAEMFFTSDLGLGDRILDSQFRFDSSEMYAAIILSGFIGYGLNQAYLRLVALRGISLYNAAGGQNDNSDLRD